MIPRWLVTLIVLLTSLVFCVNYGAQFFIEGYEPDPAITAVFGAIVGGALALSKRGPDSGSKDGGGSA